MSTVIPRWGEGWRRALVSIMPGRGGWEGALLGVAGEEGDEEEERRGEGEDGRREGEQRTLLSPEPGVEGRESLWVRGE